LNVVLADFELYIILEYHSNIESEVGEKVLVSLILADVSTFRLLRQLFYTA